MQDIAKCLHPPIQSRSCLFAIIKINDSFSTCHLVTQVKTLRISCYSLSDEYKFIWLMGYVLVTNLNQILICCIHTERRRHKDTGMHMSTHTHIRTHTRARIHTDKVKINKQQINEVNIGTS